MKVVAGLALLLVNVRLSQSCYGEGQILFCLNIPRGSKPTFNYNTVLLAFPLGSSSLVMILEDVGEINSTVFHNNNLSSVTRLRIERAGVTGIAEEAFSSFENLTSLSLDHNLLTEINPNWFSRPDVLGEFSLTGNQIDIVDESMLSGFTNLTRLSLSQNKIRTIDPNSFNSHTILAELDLSENRMSRVSPQVFRSLRSTKIRLDGNPWDCSCEAEDSVDFLKALQSRSLLDRQGEVTCESPPPLRGQPVWNVSVCVTPPPPGPPSVTQTVQAKPTDILTPVPVSAGTSARPVLQTETSVQSRPTDAPLISSHTETPPARPTSETKTSVQPKPTDDLTTVPMSTATSARFVTSSSLLTSEKTTSVQPKPADAASTTPAVKTEASTAPSATEISVHPKPSDLTMTKSSPPGVTETCAETRPSSDTNLVCTLAVVIVVLSLLLFAVCFLVVLRRRKRNNKTVMPGCPKENTNQSEEEDGCRSSHTRSPGHSGKTENDHWDSEMEMGWRRSFTGVRSKSANAILFTSPFCAPAKDKVTSQTETEDQTKDIEKQSECEQKLGGEMEVDGGFEAENQTNSSDVKAKNHVRNLVKDPQCVCVKADTVPYLSIGTNQNKPADLKKQSTEGPGQGSQPGKVMGRISTWPPTAIQWQARSKIMENEEKNVVMTWMPSEVKKALKKAENRRQDEEIDTYQSEELIKINDKITSLSEAPAQEEELKHQEMIQGPATVNEISETQNLNQESLGPTQDLKPAEEMTNKSSSKAEQRNEPKRTVSSRQRAENRGTGSKAPSGGASPDDETLLSGNEYAFMDLLHEVVQNNGRWTRDRWRQKHVKKQRP